MSQVKWALPYGVGAALGLVAPGWITIAVVALALVVVRLLILRECLQGRR